MTNNFIYDNLVMDTMASEMTQAKNLIEDAYKMANDFYLNRLKNSTIWSGESHKTMLAFMDLTLQYHKKFTDGDGSSPITEAVAALEEMSKNVEGFYDNSSYYRKMMGLV